MEENKDYHVQNGVKTVPNRTWSFFKDILIGVCIGVAFIIPGFSGGSVAAILGVYEKMINAVANIFKEMKKSIITLLPLGIGLVIGIVSLLFPLEFLLTRFPLPTVSVFVGLALGALPSMRRGIMGRLQKFEIGSFSVALVFAALLSFIPTGADVDLFNLGFFGYVLLFLVGIIGSCALVVPGISGSMLFLIFGYYNPIIGMITKHLFRFRDLGKCILVLGSCAMGIAFGFFIISIIMKQLLIKHPRATYAAIIGFIIGSLPTVYVSTMKSAGMLTQSLDIVYLPATAIHYVICLLLVLIGAAITYFISKPSSNARK
jgi:putative membrane protein